MDKGTFQEKKQPYFSFCFVTGMDSILKPKVSYRLPQFDQIVSRMFCEK